jgi:hypothetical protein
VARLFTSGWEVASNTDGHEFANVVAPAARSTAIARTGGASGRVTGFSSATPCGWGLQFVSALSDGPYWARWYFRVDTLPTGNNAIAAWIAGANPTSTSVNDGQIRLSSTGTLRLYAVDAQVGSDSAALTLGRWYRIEMAYDSSPASGSKVLRAYLDGVEWAGTGTSSNIGGTTNGFAVGANLAAETQTTGDWYFDDLGINDPTGTLQNGLPGEGSVVVIRPGSAGDANAWNNTSNAAGSTNNFQLVDETSPNDATDMVQSGTLNATDLYNFGSPSLGEDDTVNVVHVHLRRRNNVADATTAVNVVVLKTSGGTEALGTAVVPNSTTWRTGSTTSSTVLLPNYTGHVDPDGAAWTKDTVDSIQAGPRITAANVNRVQVSNVWATIDHTLAPARRFYLGNASADYTPATIRGAWDDTASAVVNKLTYVPTGAAATAAVAETSTSGTHDVLCGRWVSDPASAAGTLAGYANFVIGAGESDTAADLVWHMHIYVTVGDTDVVRGTLRTDYVGTTEFPTTASGRFVVNLTLTSTDVEIGDRLVVEAGYRAENTVATSYTGTIHYGNTGVADLRFTATSVTTDPGWIELVGAEDIFDPDVVSAEVTPSTVAAVASIPSPTLPAGATVTPSTVAVVASVPAPAITAVTAVSPAAVAATASIPGPTVATGSTVTAAVVAATTTIPTPAVATGSTITAATVAAAAVIPAPTMGAGATVAAATVAAVASVPATAVAAGATVDAATVEAVASIPGPTLAVGATVTAATVAATASVPAPTLATGSTVTAATVVAVAAIPGPSVVAGGSATATPDTVQATAAIPAAEVGAGAGVQPATVSAVAAIPTPALATGSTATAVTVAAVADVPGPALSAGATLAPGVVAAVAAIPEPAVTAGGSATATPSTVEAVAAIPTPTVPGDATITADPVTAAAAVPTPAVSAGTAVTAATVTAVAAIGAPDLAAGSTANAAAVHAVAAIPAPTAAAGTTAAPATVAVVTVIPAPTVSTSSGATITPGPVAALASVPAATYSAGVTVAVATVLAAAAIPSPTLSVAVAGRGTARTRSTSAVRTVSTAAARTPRRTAVNLP